MEKDSPSQGLSFFIMTYYANCVILNIFKVIVLRGVVFTYAWETYGTVTASDFLQGKII